MNIWQLLVAWFKPGKGYSERWLERETARLLAEAALPTQAGPRSPLTLGRRVKAH